MSQLTIQQDFDLALQHHQAGRLQEAEQIYRQILRQQPEHVDALHLQGLIAHQAGQSKLAADLIRRAIALRPDFAEAYSNLGNALKDDGQIEQAIYACRRAIALRPDLPEAHNNLGNALRDNGQIDQAIDAGRRAVALRADFPEAYNNLGNALGDNGQIDQAIDAYREAIALRPNYADAHSNLGSALANKGQLDAAIAAYRQALACDPNLPDAHSNLGVALRDTGLLDEAAAACRAAIALRHNFAEPHITLGNVLKDMGQLDEAMAAYRTAISLRPSFAVAHSNLIYTLHLHPAWDAQCIAEEHRRWNRRHAVPLGPSSGPLHRHPNDRNPDRRLRIGYVSPDFRDHVVGRGLLPLLREHNHQLFEITCYANVRQPDAMTSQFGQNADWWRNIVDLSDEQIAAQIIEDRIDILVDLAGHTANNRLLVFARKPAPVQVSYLGYPGTTGLTAIDYRLTDRFADPPDLTDHLHSERLHRLPRTNWCFAEPPHSPPVGPLPASQRGYVTFGSFNNFAKVTLPMLQAWGRILHQTPGSHLLLKAAGLAAASARDRLSRQFAAQGIDPGRLDVRGPQLDQQSHLGLYNEMDIAMDTFPYHGTTTTCEALWMGVPVITLAGQTHVSRVGVSLLSSIGLNELIASTTDEYERLAVELAGDQGRLSALRLGMRVRMRASPLMDGARFAREVEAAYRQMWRIWCENGGDGRPEAPLR
jgi:predicted O-linked N-acetylglucosamine transferase (SPINDLY family)